jgi:hypothetical protein
VQFNDVPVAGWCKERVGASDDEKKFLMGIVTADRNKTKKKHKEKHKKQHRDQSALN